MRRMSFPTKSSRKTAPSVPSGRNWNPSWISIPCRSRRSSSGGNRFLTDRMSRSSRGDPHIATFQVNRSPRSVSDKRIRRISPALMTMFHVSFLVLGSVGLFAS